MTRKRAAGTAGGRAATGAELRLRIQRFGPTPEQVQALAPRLTTHPAVRKYLAKTRHRLLGIALVDPVEHTKPAKPRAPQAFQATFFDSTHNRAIPASGEW